MNQARSSKTIVILTQVFWPDPTSVGQHLTDVAAELAKRGYHVTVFTSANGYDDPSMQYKKHELYKSIEIRRFFFSSFGKRKFFFRIFGVASFMLQCLFYLPFRKSLDGVLFSTSPPLIGLIAVLVKRIRKIPIAYWAMDLNPDQLIALGKIKKTNLFAKILEQINKDILKYSDIILTLDKYMAARIAMRGPYENKMLISPPWPHQSTEQPERLNPIINSFRVKYGLVGKFIIMYSGNHSMANPLTTLLKAITTFPDNGNVMFLFIGGGVGKQEVEQFIKDKKPSNVLSLPYQPISTLQDSLSAADVHVVSMGDNMVGIIHPCKIYGALSVGKPILYLGPSPSHISDILETVSCGWSVKHGDIEGCIKTLNAIIACDNNQLQMMGSRAKMYIQGALTQEILCSNLCNDLQRLF
jgi:colanic acid biosynthesis glycosyl transferase WcaI